MNTSKGFFIGVLALSLAACSGTERDSAMHREPEAPATGQTAVKVRPAPEHKRQEEDRAKRAPAMADAVAMGNVAMEVSAYQQAMPATVMAQQPRERERYSKWADNPVRLAFDEPVSTFSIDVDGASYSVVRSYLNQGRLPPVDAVRSEEIINSMAIDYGLRLSRREPVGLATRLLPTPWNADTHLLQVGVQAWEPRVDELPDSNYVFLLDVSGSMRGDDRLGLIQRAFSVMLGKLQARDTVALVTYASGAQTVLEPTPVSERQKILDALAQLTAGGSTHGSDGIQRAYRMAQQGFIKGGNNRVILATDGDMNVGLTGQALIDLIEAERDRGIYLTVLGVGQGNYMDAQLEPLADHGDGNYYYLDSFREAQRVLVNGLRGTAYTVAKDVKIQVEFNPAVVAEYRLIGYNNRQLATEDFNNDAKDAGELGAGHTVTALYEITLVDKPYRFIDERRYGAEPKRGDKRDELAWVKLRYKPDADSASRRIDQVVASKRLQQPDQADVSVVAAAFAEKLRAASWLHDFSWQSLQDLGQGRADRELQSLIETAALLSEAR